jgi:single stranded DNA-binding protein
MARQTFNVFTIEGNLGRDAEVKTIGQQNIQCVTFNIAGNMARNGSQQENTVWFQCNMFRNVKIVEYLKKGTRVLVSGQLEINSGQEGKTYYAITIDRVQILTRPDNQNQQPQQNNQQPNNKSSSPGPIQGNFDPFSNI